MEQMIYYYRDLLLYQTSPQLEELLSRPRVDDAFRKQAETISSGTIFMSLTN
ncbi:DNA polymerase III subunits gamma and tau [Sporolactobacillus inulinus]|uniref:DNA polymerase III subunits gamma and tau n=1 Tax=Sporolactobacillus inulinus TaxID=2078 RepID=A0A4Y1ZE75_9BACL|nr:DNA polymerase III subunits gamma and tau [Sporolactobacillus inulinus]